MCGYCRKFLCRGCCQDGVGGISCGDACRARLERHEQATQAGNRFVEASSQFVQKQSQKPGPVMTVFMWLLIFVVLVLAMIGVAFLARQMFVGWAVSFQNEIA